MLIDALRSFKLKLHRALNSTDRRAKIQDCDFIIGLLQAVANAKGNFSLGDLHRSACIFLGIKIGRSAFNERLGTTSLVKNLQRAGYSNGSDYPKEHIYDLPAKKGWSCRDHRNRCIYGDPMGRSL